jgi:hypothetical protein
MNEITHASFLEFPRFVNESLRKYIGRIASTKEGMALLESKRVKDMSLELGVPQSTLADAVCPYRNRQKEADMIKKPPTQKVLREIHLRLSIIDKEVTELKKILKGY